jgi:homoserine kinase type II
MTQYLDLQENDISGILRKYNLKQNGYESIEEGEGNTSYLVSTKQNKYVLTIFEINHVRTKNLGKLLGSLKKHGFPTTRVQKSVNGDATTIFKGKPVILKPYIVGEVVEKLNENMVRQVGVAMANLHEVPDLDYLPGQHAYGLETFPGIMSAGINLEFENWLAKRYDFLIQAIPSGLPRGLIHGDLFYDNVLFDGEKFKAVIDFEDACVYYKIFDLGMAVVGLCTEKSKIDLSKVRSLVKGYQEIRMLENDERETLQMFIAYAATATSSWRFWKYNIDTPIAELTEKHWEMVKISKVARAIPNKKFMDAVF